MNFWTGMELDKRVKSGIICIMGKGYHNRKEKGRILGLLFVVRAG
jgi:hypothetical protein